MATARAFLASTRLNIPLVFSLAAANRTLLPNRPGSAPSSGTMKSTSTLVARLIASKMAGSEPA